MKRSLAVYNKNGVLYTGNHEIGDAVLAFNTTIDLNPDFAEAHANLASLYYNKLRMKEKSYHHMREYLRLVPDGGLDAQFKSIMNADAGS